MCRSWIVLCLLIICQIVPAEEARFPLGVVIAPRNNAVPTREEQQFFYHWASQLGFNAIEHEMLPVAGGWFDWAEVQIAPDQYKWDAYDFAVADSESAGLDVYLEIFAWKNPPKWLYDRNPDMYMQTPLAAADELTKVIRDQKADTNTFPTLAHPKLVEAAEEYVATIATRFKDRKNVRGYIIGEELGLSGIWPATSFYGIDFSPAMRDAYHTHLRAKFKTIEALNKSWNHPGRYRDFSEIVWKGDWARKPAEYRGEWLEFYRCLQLVVANYHNRVARAIRKADPDAIVMVSALDTLGSRVGHGAYLPLMKDVQASAYKSFWQDNSWNVDLNSSGGHEAWCSNFSEAETTRGTGNDKRYMESRYVRRQFVPAFARGLRGAFLFLFTPDQPEKMSLLEPQHDGSLEPIDAVLTTGHLVRFLSVHYADLCRFKPDPPHIVVLDPNTTFIGQHWDFADVAKARVQWCDQTPAIQSFIDMLNRIGKANRRFEVTIDQELGNALQQPRAKVLCLLGNDLIDSSCLPAIQSWIIAGKPVIADHRTGEFNELHEENKAITALLNRDNVLVLEGNKWAQDDIQVNRLRKFLDEHVPLRYRSSDDAGPEVFTVDYMTADNGDELAAIVRKGAVGQPSARIEVELNWLNSHASLTLLDPFGQGVHAKRSVDASGNKTKVTLEGFQDVLLVIAK